MFDSTSLRRSGTGIRRYVTDADVGEYWHLQSDRAAYMG